MKSTLITVFSPKGGVGKSMIASNLAVSFRRDLNMESLVIDADASYPAGITEFLAVDGMKTMVDFFSAMKKVDRGMLKGYPSKHRSGVDVLPLSAEFGRQVDGREFYTAVEVLKEMYDYIVVDAGKTFTNNLLSVLDLSDLVLLVVGQEPQSASRAKWALSMLGSLKYPRSIVKIISNFCDGGTDTVMQAEGAPNSSIYHRFSRDDKTVMSCLSKKEPFVTLYPHSVIAKEMRSLAYLLDEEYGNMEKISRPRRTDFSSIAEDSVKSGGSVEDAGTREEREHDRFVEIKTRVHRKLIEKIDFKKIDLHEKQLRYRTEKIIEEILADEEGSNLTRQDRERIVKEVLDEALGLGPLEDLIKDESITEIMVNRFDQIYIERNGRLELIEKKFIDDNQVLAVIERIVSPVGERIDESIPYVDARLSDGSRVNAVISPLSLQGPMLTIRKFPKKRLVIGDLIRFASLDERIAELIRVSVLLRKNIVVSGGTGSGKTSLLNAISSFIPAEQRIITIEDTAELKLTQPHVGILQARRPNIEGKGEIPIRTLVRNALRMRPDRIIVGECRGGEALDMLQAMNTGHDGSLTTVHANSARDALARLETLVLMAGFDLPSRAIREQIASAVNIIIQTQRIAVDGSRKIVSVTEVTGMEGDAITAQEIFSFVQTGVSAEGRTTGYFRATGVVPTFFEELRSNNIELKVNIFD